jgi:hypothetical protein
MHFAHITTELISYNKSMISMETSWFCFWIMLHVHFYIQLWSVSFTSLLVLNLGSAHRSGSHVGTYADSKKDMEVYINKPDQYEPGWGSSSC